jgi:hypothetical protein
VLASLTQARTETKWMAYLAHPSVNAAPYAAPSAVPSALPSPGTALRPLRVARLARAHQRGRGLAAQGPIQAEALTFTGPLLPPGAGPGARSPRPGPGDGLGDLHGSAAASPPAPG